LDSCKKSNEIPVPHFAQLIGQRLYLTQEMITDGQAASLADLLFKAGDQRVVVMKNEIEKENNYLI